MKIKDAIANSGIPANESRILLMHFLDCSLEYLLMNGDEEIEEPEYFRLVDRRKNHEPIAYIIGRKEFYSREFIVDSSVLIPRPDSELMIDVITRYCEEVHSTHAATQKSIGEFSRTQDLVCLSELAMTPRCSIIELGVGSGCLLLTLLLELPNAIGEAVDISEDAVKISSQNMKKFDLSKRCKIYRSNWFEKVERKFDIIISNPPYINKDDQDIMSQETILHEPSSALYSEEKGFADYKKIADKAHEFLNPNGLIFLEIGIGQKDDVARIFENRGFVLESVHKDLRGIDRVISLSRHCEEGIKARHGKPVI